MSEHSFAKALRFIYSLLQVPSYALISNFLHVGCPPAIGQEAKYSGRGGRPSDGQHSVHAPIIYHACPISLITHVLCSRINITFSDDHSAPMTQ